MHLRNRYVNMVTKKRALACRVSNETFEAVKALTEGDKPPFESTSEYLYTLVLSDLGKRSAGNRTVSEEVKEYLHSPEGLELLRCIARETCLNNQKKV